MMSSETRLRTEASKGPTSSWGVLNKHIRHFAKYSNLYILISSRWPYLHHRKPTFRRIYIYMKKCFLGLKVITKHETMHAESPCRFRPEASDLQGIQNKRTLATTILFIWGSILWGRVPFHAPRIVQHPLWTGSSNANLKNYPDRAFYRVVSFRRLVETLYQQSSSTRPVLRSVTVLGPTSTFY